MEGRVIVKFDFENNVEDFEVPLNITANELIFALKQRYNIDDFLSSENPIALIKGESTLEEIGIRDGSIIYGRRKN